MATGIIQSDIFLLTLQYYKSNTFLRDSKNVYIKMRWKIGVHDHVLK